MRSLTHFLMHSLRCSVTLMIGLALSACADLSDLEDDHGLTDKLTNGQLEAGDPYVALLRSGQAVICSGTLITPQIVLTAAHCVETVSPTNVNSVTFTSGGNTIDLVEVVDRVMHTGWQGRGGGAPDEYTAQEGNDIALLYLSRPANVQPIGLDPTPPQQQIGRVGEVVGFGISEIGNQSTSGFSVMINAMLERPHEA